jgi:hypothetical protein
MGKTEKLSNKLSNFMEQTSWEANSYSASQISRPLLIPKVHVFARAHHWSVSRSRWVQSITSHPISLKFVLILSSPWSLPFRFSDKHLFCVSYLSRACYVPHPYHLPWLNQPNSIWRSVQVMKVLIVQSLQTSHHFLPLWSVILLNNLFPNSLSICSSISVRDQVSHKYRTTGKTVVLCILIFKFLERRQEGKRF